MDFYNLACQRGDNAPACGIDQWVAGLPGVFPASLLKNTQWGFAVFEAVHLLGLALLGGCVLLLNLRLMGAGLTDDPASKLERTLRPWLWLGIGLVLGTGVIIGMLNPEKLYTSPAFFAKMVAMTAALIFSLGVTSSIARREGVAGAPVMAAAVIAFGLWLWSIDVFATSKGTNPGTFHLVVAGYVILMFFGRLPVRLIGLAVAAALACVYVVYGYLVIGGPGGDYDQFMNQTKLCVQLAALALVGLLGFEIFSRNAADMRPVGKLVALFSMLSWVTVSAAGRWIGLS